MALTAHQHKNRVTDVPFVTDHNRQTPPCKRCGLPLLKGERKCPRCRGAHWKDPR